MTRSEAIKKIKKAMALAKSANANESAIAMRQAQALMREHAIGQHEAMDLEESDVAAKSFSVDMHYLVAKVNEAFGVSAVLISKGRSKAARFFGRPDRVHVAAYCFQVLSRQCYAAKIKHLARVKSKKNRAERGDAFGCAYMYAACKLLDVFELSADDVNALTTYQSAAYPKTQESKVVDRSKNSRTNGADRSAGFTAGESAKLRKGVQESRLELGSL